ncbi:MAG TPA: twin-arginine translocase TatA/TatE family subunit [Solirubrobacteraceae bacterium]|jgi:sec-independent protein translocase protein TatA|nr:twin-arginine translocase TatA/TatE family subunit [Solirubrobacteraceae bacterium]
MGLDNPLHILLLLLIVLLVFGAKRLPEIGRSLGTGLHEFKQSVTGDHQQPTLTAAAPPAQPQPAPAQQAAPPAAQKAPTPPPAS